MRNLHELDDYRDCSQSVIQHYGDTGDDTVGVFRLQSPIDRAEMLIVASGGMGWEHVSVSRRNRCPNWTEMEFIKRSFFKPDEVCMQLHVAESEHVSLHPHCLHIWRPTVDAIPLPPAWMVGPVEATPVSEAVP